MLKLKILIFIVLAALAIVCIYVPFYVINFYWASWWAMPTILLCIVVGGYVLMGLI